MAFALYTILLAHLIELLMALFDYSFNIGLSNCDETDGRKEPFTEVRQLVHRTTRRLRQLERLDNSAVQTTRL